MTDSGNAGTDDRRDASNQPDGGQEDQNQTLSAVGRQVDRRQFLKLMGYTAGGAAFAGAVGTGRLQQYMRRMRSEVRDRAVTGMQAGTPDETVSIDYDGASSPSDVYNVNDVRGSHQPQFVDSPTKNGDSALQLQFSSAQKVANCEYRFPDNGHGMPNEIYTRFYLYPDGFQLSANTTVRIFWLPLTNGTGSSGGGHPNGTNGWSNAIGFANRNNSPAPDGYKFFSYSYHMDKPGSSGEFEMTDEPIMMDEWNLIEGYVKCNSYSSGSAQRDGIMRYWINGELAFERTELRMTTSDSNRIEGVGPLGYVVGDDLSGSSLIYDQHEIAIGGMPEDRDDLDTGGGGESSRGASSDGEDSSMPDPC